ncbi:MAG: STAS domain-containing protein [Candidatus Acidiferrales bacterium]
MAFVITERERVGSVVLVELSGRLVMSEGSDKLEEELQRRIAAGEHAMLLDCGGVSVIDSQGLKALMRGVISIRKVGGQLKLLNVAPRVREVLELTRLLTIIEVFDNRDDAVRSFGGA